MLTSTDTGTPPTPPATPPPAVPAGTTDPVKTLAVPLNPDGTIGTLPDQLQQLVDARIRDATARVKAKAGGTDPDPVAIEKLKTLEKENEAFKIAEHERQKQYDEATKIREDRYAAEQRDLQAEVERRTKRLESAALGEVKAAALKHGAREEALDDIATLVRHRIGVDPKSLDTIVKGEDGKPMDGGTVDALVKEFLDAKPIFKKPPPSGGGARGGAYLATGKVGAVSAAQAEYDAAREAFARASSTENMNRMRAAKVALEAAKSAA